MIHVCYCFCDKTGRYAKFVGTSLLSLLEHTKSEVTVHILHDNTLTDDNRDKISSIAEQSSQLVKFYNLDEICPNKLSEIAELIPDLEKESATIGTFYKLLIPQILSTNMEKVIFIDPDTIINLDIAELWQTELEDKILGVVTEAENGTDVNKTFLLCREDYVQEEDYFNCGVLLMNLNILRGEEETITDGIKFRGENSQYKFLDSTVLNYCFSTRTLKLPTKFNSLVRQERTGEDREAGEKIYHYAKGKSRMGLDTKDPFNRLWMNYFMKTPWFDVETFGQLYKTVQKIRNDLKNSSTKILKAMTGKMRVFFVEPEKLENVKEFFEIKNYEEVILAENSKSIPKLIDTMKNYRGMCLFFIMTEKFLKKGFPFDKLKKAGFAEYKDFVKGWTLLPGGSLDSYPLIEAM